MVRLVILFLFLLALPLLAGKKEPQDGVTELCGTFPDSAGIWLTESLCRAYFGDSAADRAIAKGEFIINHEGDKKTVCFYEKCKKIFCIRTLGFIPSGAMLDDRIYDPLSKSFIRLVPAN